MSAEFGQSIALWVFLCAGHSHLCAAVLNRVHAIPKSCATLHRIRVIHDLFLIILPVWLAWKLSGANPLLSVSQSALWGGWPAALDDSLYSGYLILATAGCCGLIWSTLMYQFRLAISPHRQEASTRIDVAQALAGCPVGEGIHSEMTRWPWNEQFQVEISRREFTIPSLPAELDRLRILHLSDWHFHGAVTRSYFEFVCNLVAQEPADILVFTGDLLDDMRCLNWIEPTLGRLRGRLGQFFILGNHDWYLDDRAIRDELVNSGWIDVGSKVVQVQVQGIQLALGGDETPWMGTAPELHRAPADFHILLSHTPDNFPRAALTGIPLVLAGHTHGGQVSLPVLGPIYAPSWFGTRFASGTFHKQDCTMHVSRGLSGRHPYRFHCLPEVTFITLSRSHDSSGGSPR